MKVKGYANTTLFLCPKCFDEAFPTVTNNQGLIVLHQCRGCGHQTYTDNFIKLDTGDQLQEDKNLLNPRAGDEPGEN